MRVRTLSSTIWLARVSGVLSLCVVVMAMGVVKSPRSAQAQSASCVSMSEASADAVFDQALSTVRSVINGALRAGARGSWRPDGSFKGPFLSQSADSLRRIRVELSQDPVSKTALLAAFDGIFSVRFPKGIEGLARLKRSERRKFIATLDALPNIAGSCAP